jgi:NDP-sugar pyrophosphorylase family protein
MDGCMIRPLVWKAGIIAAGAGERLRAAGGQLKPLVRVGGETLIERVLASIGEVAPSEIVVIVNEEAAAVREHVSRHAWPFSVRWIVETTPSSMHSFIRVLETLAATGGGGPFLISAVDTVAAPGEYARFADASRRLDADVALAVTPNWDDEKPLLVQVDERRRVTAMGAAVGMGRSERSAGRVFATAGYYAVRPVVLEEAQAARDEALPALRTFLGRLVEQGYDVAAVPVGDAIDVDRPGDISAAEAFLKQVRA